MHAEPYETCPHCGNRLTRDGSPYGEELFRRALELIAYHEAQDDERAEAMRKIAREALDEY